MPRQIVVYGPPGTGKTTFGTGIVRDWVREGTDSRAIAYLGFTRASAKAAVMKILESEVEVDSGAVAERFPLFRTIHSLAYRGLNQARPGLKVVVSSDMKRFSESTGCEGQFSQGSWEDISDTYRHSDVIPKNHWDKALLAYGLTRMASTTPESLERSKRVIGDFARKTIGFLEPSVYRLFVERYEAFKHREGLVDFTDMLAFALADMSPLDHVKYAIIDEAQDLCPIHYAIVDRLFNAAEQVWWIGDDDQALYAWSGAVADLFVDRGRSADGEIPLRETHRFGASIVDFSRSIISRVSGKRVEKTILGVKGREGKVRYAPFTPETGDLLILHRHVVGCQGVAREYIYAGLPFINERGKNPLGADARVLAWTALDRLARGRAADALAVKKLIQDIIPSVVLHPETQAKRRLVLHGAKTKMDEIGSGDLRLEDLRQGEILTLDGISAIINRQYHYFKEASDLIYYDKVSKNGFDIENLDYGKVPRITTIHGSKGRQAERVTVFTEMGDRCWQDPDTEHRLAYVAATRTQTDVLICPDRKVDWARSSYHYPKPNP